MNELIAVQETMSSSQLAEMLHYEKKEVNKKIRSMFGEEGREIFSPALNPNGTVDEYHLPEKESKMFVAKHDINYLEQVIEFWISKHAVTPPPPPLPLIPIQRAKVQVKERLEIYELFKVPLNLAYIEVVKEVGIETGVDLSPVLQLAPAMNNISESDIYLEPMDIGKKFNISAIQVNRVLMLAGLQVKNNGSWVATDTAIGMQTKHQWSKGFKSGYNLKWSISKIQQLFEE